MNNIHRYTSPFAKKEELYRKLEKIEKDNAELKKQLVEYSKITNKIMHNLYDQLTKNEKEMRNIYHSIYALNDDKIDYFRFRDMINLEK